MKIAETNHSKNSLWYHICFASELCSLQNPPTSMKTATLHQLSHLLRRVPGHGETQASVLISMKKIDWILIHSPKLIMTYLIKAILFGPNRPWLRRAEKLPTFNLLWFEIKYNIRRALISPFGTNIIVMLQPSSVGSLPQLFRTLRICLSFRATEKLTNVTSDTFRPIVVNRFNTFGNVNKTSSMDVLKVTHSTIAL